MLLQLLLVAGFFFMMTALTYQFQGWLASLMVNKRRRRTIIATVTVAFILLAQLPNLANVIGGPLARKKFDTGGELAKQTADLQAMAARKEITFEELEKRQKELTNEFKERNRAAAQELYEKADQTARLASLVLPIGWLPLGSMGLAEGGVLAAFLGTIGFCAIGGISLWRSYKTTLRLYTGQYTSGKRPSLERALPPTVAPQPKTAIPASNPLERDIRGLSEQSTVVALSSFRSLLRAPEAKMMLLSPLILVVVFGSIMFTHSTNLPEQLRPFMASGGVAMILFTLSQLIGNQFGFDRNGFRVFLLCPAPRRDILLGKNAAAAPFVLTLSVLVVVFIQVVYPMRVDLFLSLLPQIVSMFLLYCLIGNLASILVPMRIAPGTMKPMNTRSLPLLGHIGMMLLLPVILSVTVVPLLFQLALQNLGWIESVPLALILSILECLAIGVFYHFAIGWEGDLLQAREQRILELVVTKEE
jgi:ABC-2 type transport system permease protein